MTISEIKQAIKNKSWKSEEYIDEFGLLHIGFSVRTGVWYWFIESSLSKSEITDEFRGNIQFSERYSQNNGNCQRGFSALFRAEKMVEKALQK